MHGCTGQALVNWLIWLCLLAQVVNMVDSNRWSVHPLTLNEIYAKFGSCSVVISLLIVCSSCGRPDHYSFPRYTTFG